jgi:4-amino-4-deoxy-L-arabinose transferase-like glycosyltransferase
VAFGDQGDPIATAFHLPLFPAVLSVASLTGLDSYEAHQAIGWAFGAGTVAVLGLIGRRLGGAALGLVTAAIAALYLPLAINDALLMSESLYGLLIALVLLAALRLYERPSAARAVVLGAAIAAAALTRSEALLLAVLLVPWAAGEGRARLRNTALAAAVIVLAALPWALRNSLEFDQPVLLTTGDGSVLAGANLPSTYRGHLFGAWDFEGLYDTPAGRTVVRNEAEQSERWRDEGLDYAADNAGRLPAVMAVRVLRTWSLYPWAPADKARFASDHYRHVRALEYVAFPSLLVVVALALAGLPRVRTLGARKGIFLAPIVLVTLVSAFGYGDTRFRQAADVSLVVLAGVGACALAPRASAMRPRPGART